MEIDRVQALFLDEFPAPLDQIEVGRIGWEIQKLDAKRLDEFADKITPLITRLDALRSKTMGLVFEKLETVC